MSNYIKWYSKEQNKFKLELSNFTNEQIALRQDYIKARAARLGLINYCREHKFLQDNFSIVKVNCPDSVDSTKTIKNRLSNLFTTVLNWCKKGVFKYAQKEC